MKKQKEIVRVCVPTGLVASLIHAAKFEIHKPYEPPSPELTKARQEYVEILFRLGKGLEADEYMSHINMIEKAPMRIKAVCVLDRW